MITARAVLPKAAGAGAPNVGEVALLALTVTARLVLATTLAVLVAARPEVIARPA